MSSAARETLLRHRPSAAILILRKNKVDGTVLFIDASREFKSGKNQNQLSPENIEEIVATYKVRQVVEKYAISPCWRRSPRSTS